MKFAFVFFGLFITSFVRAENSQPFQEALGGVPLEKVNRSIDPVGKGPIFSLPDFEARELKDPDSLLYRVESRTPSSGFTYGINVSCDSKNKQPLNFVASSFGNEVELMKKRWLDQTEEKNWERFKVRINKLFTHLETDAKILREWVPEAEDVKDKAVLPIDTTQVYRLVKVRKILEALNEK